MKKFLMAAVVFVLFVTLAIPQTGSAAASPYYYTVEGGNKTAPGIYKSVPNGKSTLVLKGSSKVNFPIQDVQSVGKDLYYTQFVKREAFDGGMCGGGYADHLEIYKKSGSGKSLKVTSDKVSNNAVNSFFVQGSSIYYAKIQDTAFRNFVIIKSSLDGKKKQTLVKGAEDFWVRSNSLYYIKSGMLYKMDANGKNIKAISGFKTKLYNNGECDGANYQVSPNGLVTQDYDSNSLYSYEFQSGKVMRISPKFSKESPTAYELNPQKKQLAGISWNGSYDTLEIFDFTGKKLKTIKKNIDYSSIYSLDLKKGQLLYIEGSQLKLYKL